MRVEQQQKEFEALRQRVADLQFENAVLNSELHTLGESLFCYVPRQFRGLTFGNLLTLSYSGVTPNYGSGSWAINDLMILLERTADSHGTCGISSSAPAPFCDKLRETVASQMPSESPQMDRLPDRITVPATSETECAPPYSSENIRTEFEQCREALTQNLFRKCLSEPLSEFLEPDDVDIPIGFLTLTIRDVLDKPTAYWLRRWTGQAQVRSLLKLIKRAVSLIDPDSDVDAMQSVDQSQPQQESESREIHVDDKRWRQWCDAIRNAGLQDLKLGQVATCLRDLSVTLWTEPLHSFIGMSLNHLKRVQDVGHENYECVVASIRSLGVELVDLPRSSTVRLKYIPGPLRSTQDWLLRLLEERRIPDLTELTTHILRPMSWQLRHDLVEREAQIAISRLQLDESVTRPTLEELATAYGVSRERIRQLEQWGPRVLQVRFPQGRFLLDALYGQLITVPEGESQAQFVRRIATLSFDSEITAVVSSVDVVRAWNEASRLQHTPMTVEHIRQWCSNRLPGANSTAVFETIRSNSICVQQDGHPPYWFARTEIDRILSRLYEQRKPVRLDDLMLLDNGPGETSLAESKPTSATHAEDKRSLWGRIRRDSRFVEYGDHHLLMASECCGFQRIKGKWVMYLILQGELEQHRDWKMSFAALAEAIVDRFRQRGIVDATAWGVHRFASEYVAEKFLARLPHSVTPLVLADMLVKESDGLIRTMRRRRLRWEQGDHEHARGKRGWVGYVVAEYDQPMLLSELASRLRDYYQDYADYVVNQLTTITDEDGEIDERAQFVTGLGHGIPIIVMPTNWAMDSTARDVSTGVAQLIQRLARQVRSGRLSLDELLPAGWLKSLVEVQMSTSPEANTSDDVDEPEYVGREEQMYPISVTRIGNCRMPRQHPIPAFVVVRGRLRSGDIDRAVQPTFCNHCGSEIALGESFAVENIDRDQLLCRRGFQPARVANDGSELADSRLPLYPLEDWMRRWCLSCIDYDHITEYGTSTTELPLPVDESSQELLNAAELGHLHLSRDPRRVLAADFEQLVENLIGYAFGRILSHAPPHKPWSLAELCLVEGDVVWLKELFQRLTASHLRDFLSQPSRFEGYSSAAQLGVVLLLLESELARRHALEGQLWSAIYKQVAWEESTSRYLFNHRQPNARHKSFLEAAAKELGLRCAFGEDSAQEWYQSVFLQCGFSKTSFESRLPEWLAGQNAPISVTRLLGADTRYASATFKVLWGALKEYRQGSLDRSELQTVLESSPWILREWHESLIRLTRAGSHSSPPTDGRSTKLGDDNFQSADRNSERRFLSEPRLRSLNGTFQFFCIVEVADGLELEDDADIIISGEVRSRLILQADGSLHATPSEIDLPTSSPTLIAELRTFSAVTIATQAITIWEDDDDVAGFVVRTGRPIDPWSRDFTERETFLIYSADLRIEPSRAPVAVLGNGSRIAVRMLPQETCGTRLLLGADVLWEPDTHSYPKWRDSVIADVELRPRESPNQFRVSVSSPSEVTATAIRFRKTLFDLKRDSANRSSTDWTSLDSELRSAEAITFTVFVRAGAEKTEIRRRVLIRLPGQLWRTGDQWEEVPSRTTVDLRELRLADFRFSPPDSEIQGEHWQLFEGRRWIDSVKKRPQRITAVDGWGAPLILRAAPYNCCQPEQPLLQGLTDQGEIRDVDYLPDGSVTISLHRPIAPDKSHAIVTLDEFGTTQSIQWTELAQMWHGDESPTTWRFSSLNCVSVRQIKALAIAYNGERLGSCWQRDWTTIFNRQEGLSRDESATWASSVANAMRWFHLPLLSQDSLPCLRQFANAFAVPVLSAWMNSRVSQGLIHDAVGEGWLCVVRSIFADWLPGVEEAEGLDKALESALSDGTDLPLKTTAMALADVSSLLACRFIRARLTGNAFKSAKVNETRALIAAIRMQVMGRDSVDSLVVRVAQDVARTDDPPEGTLDFVRDSLLVKLRTLLDHPDSPHVTDLDRSNIEVAMRLGAFRRLGVVAGLDRIIKELL